MVFTDCDLDGAVSYLTFKWFHEGHTIDVCDTHVMRFRDDYVKWLAKSNSHEYDKIFILDLDVGEHKDLIDKANHFIIDHHKTHVLTGPYKKATAVVKEYTSACKMAYKTFKALYGTDLNDAQKKLIALGDDYDSYTHKVVDSRKLNIVYWNTQNRFDSFVNNFGRGYNGLTVQQENIIRLYLQELENIKTTMQVYYADVNIKDTSTRIMSTFASTAINDVSDILLNDYDADIALVVNLESGRVSFRRAKRCDHVNLLDLVKKVCDDEGGGHEYAAGGAVNDTFIEFTKILKPYERQ